jgi:uncharacterized membrane protein
MTDTKMSSPANPTLVTDTILHQPRLYAISVASLIALIVLCAAWEWFLAPLRPGGSWLVLKAVLLAAPLPGLLRRNRYTMQWSTMFILLYFTEGIVRGFADPPPVSWLAFAEIALSLVYFASTVLYLRPFKRRARANHVK